MFEKDSKGDGTKGEKKEKKNKVKINVVTKKIKKKNGERERERERGEYMLLIRLVRLILMYTCNEFHLNF